MNSTVGGCVFWQTVTPTGLVRTPSAAYAAEAKLPVLIETDIGGEVPIDNPTRRDALLHMPSDSRGKTVHVIFEVTDDGKPTLTRYRRIVVTGT